MKVKDIQPRTAAAVNDAVIKAWKEAYPRGVWEITVEDKKGFVRKPTRIELSAALTIKDNPLLQSEDLLRSAWLGGDEELLEDDDYFQGALMQFHELMAIKAGEIKKL